MKFAIQINASPHASATCDTAYGFIRAALAEGHAIPRIFFYHEGVYCAFRQAIAPGDTASIAARWSRLAEDHGIDMVVCVTAAARRGLVVGDGQALDGCEANGLADGFRISGLGQAVESMLECDRLIQFGGL